MKIQTFLPAFKGFYGSNYESYIDNEVNQILDDTGKDYDCFDWQFDFEGLAKSVTELTTEYIKENLPGLILDINFVELISPKYYNYSNDKILVDIDFNLYSLLKTCKDSEELLKNNIKKDFTPSSGWLPYLSSEYEDWLNTLKNPESNLKDFEVMVPCVIEYLLDTEDFEYFIFDRLYFNEFVTCTELK